MKYHRPDRVTSLLQDQLNKLMLREIDIPDVLITITDVHVSKDVTEAMIKVSVIPSEKGEEVLEILQKAKRGLQWKLVRMMNIKPTPHIDFKLDHGTENAAKVEKALLDSDGNEKAA
jgi:ribosome-binding factor A